MQAMLSEFILIIVSLLLGLLGFIGRLLFIKQQEIEVDADQTKGELTKLYAELTKIQIQLEERERRRSEERLVEQARRAEDQERHQAEMEKVYKGLENLSVKFEFHTKELMRTVAKLDHLVKEEEKL